MPQTRKTQLYLKVLPGTLKGKDHLHHKESHEKDVSLLISLHCIALYNFRFPPILTHFSPVLHFYTP